MAATQFKERLWTRDFILITFVNLLVFTGFQMLMPTLPVFVSKLGGSETQAGLVIGVFAISAVLVRPFSGMASDRYGRKGIFLSGLIVFTLSVLAYNLAPSVLILLFFRFVHGLGWGASSTASGTIASDIIPKSRLGEGMGYFGMVGTVAMAAAPALGLALVNNYGFTPMFLSSAAMVLAATVIALTIKYHQIKQDVKGKAALFETSAISPAAVVFFVSMTYGAVVTFIALYGSQLGISNIGPFFTVYALVMMLARPLFGRAADKRGYDIVIIPGIVCVAAAMLLLFAAKGMGWVLAAGICYGLGFGAVQPSLQAMAVRNVPPFRRGAANGTFFTGFDLGIGVGSILWGSVANALGYSKMYLWAVVPAIISLALYFLVGRSGRLVGKGEEKRA